MLEILDFEKTLALADALAEASDRLSAGEAVSGPAADRYIAAADEFSARYAGGFATKGQMKALRNNPRLQIFEDPQALLTCNLDPYKALCDPDLAKDTKPSLRTPNWNRRNPACANISRTDTHMQRAWSATVIHSIGVRFRRGRRAGGRGPVVRGGPGSGEFLAGPSAPGEDAVLGVGGGEVRAGGFAAGAVGGVDVLVLPVSAAATCSGRTSSGSGKSPLRAWNSRLEA
ncbi:hypothetical protein [Streptomyces sp. SD31]|uniref:hypothetical protein n=1 Tax=Streptomyces sp. SD31 TaxID=3452208 RepID=UPI003F8C358B